MIAKFGRVLGVSALMLSASSAAVLAAIMFVPTNGGIPAANELFGTSIIDQPFSITNQVRVESSGNNTFTNSEMRVKFTFSGGASIATAVLNGDLTGDLNTGANAAAACGTVPTIIVQSGGGVGDTFVEFAITNASSCRALRLNVPRLQGITQGATVQVSSTLKTAIGTDVDSGVINSPLDYMKQVDANTGSIGTANAHIVDLSNASKTLIASTSATATTFVTGFMNDKLVEAYKEDLVTQFKNSNNGATGVLTLSGLPTAATTTAPTLRVQSAGATLAGHAGGTLIGTCTAPAGTQTSTCTLTNANMVSLIDAIGTKSLTALITVNGLSAIANSTINAKLVVSYAAAGDYKPITSETKFDGVVASVGTNTCAAEYASVIGTNAGGFVSTIRIANTSALAGKVYLAATKDDGTHGEVVQLTQANTGATQGLDASNLLQPGAALEILGSQAESASGVSFSAWGGATSRGRVRIMLEAAGAVAGPKALSKGQNGADAGCVSEGFVCMGTSCTIMQQTTGGVDNTPKVKQSN